MFLQITSVLIDLTKSFHTADWNLHLSALRRALPLFFAFGRTNYTRWAPIYYEECLSLPSVFPSIHSEFSKGNFVANITDRRGSAIPINF